jgi:hypothetical protein
MQEAFFEKVGLEDKDDDFEDVSDSDEENGMDEEREVPGIRKRIRKKSRKTLVLAKKKRDRKMRKAPRLVSGMNEE